MFSQEVVNMHFLVKLFDIYLGGCDKVPDAVSFTRITFQQKSIETTLTLYTLYSLEALTLSGRNGEPSPNCVKIDIQPN